jgi:hypothetical protein
MGAVNRRVVENEDCAATRLPFRIAIEHLEWVGRSKQGNSFGPCWSIAGTSATLTG